MSESGFFTTNTFLQEPSAIAPELIHESESGWARLYRIDKDGRFRVLKALKEEYREDVKYEILLRKEYEIGYRLSHPNLCQTYGFAEIEGLGHCIEMEWINGVPLDVFLSGRKITRELSSRIIAQLCDAVAYCHSCQVVHRDIKPENIMITHSGNNVKLIDFGLSDSDVHSVFKSACGTAVFAAPELLEGGRPDVLSDIYSLGKIIALLHPSFSGVAARCTKADPSRRYPDVEAVKAAASKVRKKNGRAYALAAACLIGTVLFAIFCLHPQSEPEATPGRAETGIVSEQDGIASQQSGIASELPDTPAPTADTVAALPAPSRSPARTGEPSAPSRKSSDYDADDIDELFKMATELVDQSK